MLRYTDYDIVFQEIPDEVTLAINISNCPNRCKGCHSAYLMEDVGDLLTEESLSALLQKYGDIIEMERPQTEESLRKHPRMTLQNRAKIFSPFAALRGYDEQLAAEKQRTERVPKRILTEEEMSALSDRLMQVTKGMTITVRYFKEDTAHPEVPAVGNYITLTGKADRIDPVFRTLQVGDTVVPFEDLVEISGEGIMEIDQYLGITED